jgi:hypothetical protein
LKKKRAASSISLDIILVHRLRESAVYLSMTLLIYYRLTALSFNRCINIIEIEINELLTTGLDGAETWGSFAHVCAQGDPEVSAPGKPWIKS